MMTGTPSLEIDMSEPTGIAEDYPAYYADQPTEKECDHPISVTVVGTRCVYLNNYRIVGGKPYVSEGLPERSFETTVREALFAFSEQQLRAALKERRARKRYFGKWREASEKITASQSA